MERISVTQIKDLVSAFSNKSLPKERWTHQAHIIVGLWYNYHHDFDSALDLVKTKIKEYNISVGTENTDTSGYHETMTIFWMVLTKKFLLRHSNLQLEEAVHIFLQGQYAAKTYPFTYYSREVLFSKEARKNWINGDIKRISLLSNEYKLNNHFDLSDEQFESEFKACTLLPTLFSHEAHLRLAWIHLKKAKLEIAIANICNQIIAFVQHLGAEEKYNHTLTVAAINVVHHFMQKSDIDNFFDFVLRFPVLKSGFKGLINAHYSFDIFDSVEAKRAYIEPDLVPFDS